MTTFELPNADYAAARAAFVAMKKDARRKWTPSRKISVRSGTK